MGSYWAGVVDTLIVECLLCFAVVVFGTIWRGASGRETWLDKRWP